MISGLKTEGQINPVGLDIVQPRFSWVLESSKRNVRQVAYELTVRQGKNRFGHRERCRLKIRYMFLMPVTLWNPGGSIAGR